MWLAYQQGIVHRAPAHSRNRRHSYQTRLVGEAGEVAQLDAHQLQLRLEIHQIREAIDTAIKSSRQALLRHRLEVNIPQSLPPVRMDLERITEVIIHLLDNAGKYSPPDTPICITAELRDSDVVISVADHGPGIDEMEQEMIFEKFYRGRNQRMIIQGTGMGLPIVKAIVELHGGKT